MFLSMFQHFHRLVARGIEDDREIKTLFAHQRDKKKNMGKEMVRSDKVDVVNMMMSDHAFQLLKQFLLTHAGAQALMGNLVILAE